MVRRTAGALISPRPLAWLLTDLNPTSATRIESATDACFTSTGRTTLRPGSAMPAGSFLAATAVDPDAPAALRFFTTVA